MSMRNVVGVLEDRPSRLWSTFYAAVELADHQHARLTLVKTCTASQLYAWCGPLTVSGLYVPPEEDPQVNAGRLLARAAEFVPMEIPVTTVLLGLDTQKDLCRLIKCGCYDALVADERFLRRARKLRRECGHSDVATLSVHATPHGEPGTTPAAPALSTAR